MSDATVTYLGSDNAASPDLTVSGGQEGRELFLKLFSGQVINAFDEKRTMKGRLRERTITSGKSAQFIVTGKTTGQRHIPGVERKGTNNLLQSERVIYIDYPISSDVFLSRFDEALSHWDGRSEIANQMGQYLANRWDEDALTQVVLAARGSGVITDDPAGNSDIDADADDTVANIKAAFWRAIQQFDETDVPWRGTAVAHMAPAQYYLLAQDKEVYTVDWTEGTNGGLDTGRVKMYAGVPIIMTNHLPRTNRAAEAAGGEINNYAGDFRYNVFTIHTPEAVGAVKLWDVTSYLKDQRAERGGTLLVSELACGMGVLRPGAAFEVKTA